MSLTDRELLELAAEAARLYVCSDLDCLGLKEWGDELWVKEDKYGTFRKWNPLTDDGDALRLAIALRISFFASSNNTACDIPNTDDYVWENGTDPASARRAIVRAAAEIGKAMQEKH